MTGDRSPSTTQLQRASHARSLFRCTECGAPTIAAVHEGPGHFRLVCHACSGSGTLPSVVPGWTENAECLGDPPPDHRADQRAWTLLHCVRCPVVAECAAYGRRDPHPSGKTVYAGLTSGALVKFESDEEAVRAAGDFLFELALEDG